MSVSSSEVSQSSLPPAVGAGETHSMTDASSLDNGLQPSLSQDNADDASSKYIVNKLKQLYRNHVAEAEKEYHL